VNNEILLPKGKIILLGNEAIVRGALEAGVKFASTYPGTPASEIGDTFSKIAKEAKIYFEYSTNEKVALEAAAGAAFSGLRSIVSFKHFGLNVAADSFMPIAYVGTKAGLVIVSADDPNCWSSAQSEQDSRFYSLLAHVPMLEPTNAQECKDFTKFAFDLSEKFDLPVLIRLTTRVSHSRGIVKLGKIIKKKVKPKFVKDLEKFNNLPPHTMEMHERILEKIRKIRKISEKTKINFFVNKNVKSKFGIIVSGVSFNYVIEALNDLDLKIPVLKLGLTQPLPQQKIGNFIKKLSSVLIVEELEPIIEKEVRAIAREFNPRIKIYGKNVLPKSGEYREENIIEVIGKVTGRKFRKINLSLHKKKVRKVKIPKRFAVLCPGCQHRAAFYAVKKVAKDAIFGGDIGCYTLGIYPPLHTQDFIFSMGASIGVIHGIKKATNQKTICFLGDSTFFHAGIPGLINTLFNKSNPLVIILDNRYTAMTGHQPHPGTGYTGMHEQTKEIKIEDVVKGLGIQNVKVVDPFNLSEMEKSVKGFLKKDEVSVIVAKRECQLMAFRRKKRKGIKIPKFEIDQNKCAKCGICLYEFGCPAIYEKNGKFYVDKTICTGCAVCVQLCPFRAIHISKEE
jgi:indolepyruvate ferredoxin oxidoreductase alpha subunit